MAAKIAWQAVYQVASAPDSKGRKFVPRSKQVARIQDKRLVAPGNLVHAKHGCSAAIVKQSAGLSPRLKVIGNYRPLKPELLEKALSDLPACICVSESNVDPARAILSEGFKCWSMQQSLAADEFLVQCCLKARNCAEIDGDGYRARAGNGRSSRDGRVGHHNSNRSLGWDGAGFFLACEMGVLACSGAVDLRRGGKYNPHEYM
ncbi:hypothetical protein BOTBODRAFT_49730 [Botryobasidium botryosum FD-172 SS1]|uniref:Uncharacterized protein n=1 Tax=Botryobasidium botryosum (strain FD-172 SS1) TaxID=930990 RepID=A0A067LR78_BOTB1|nr:hypothetical protein BOTBODRAFT_49730 [Botryobasidium botryosum FD-172 SS1]